jgi:hypothetical protein
MALPHWRAVVVALHEDQGDLPCPESFQFDTTAIDRWDLADAYLRSLTPAKRVEVAVGDQDDIGRIIAAGAQAGEALHAALDEIFMQIGG